MYRITFWCWARSQLISSTDGPGAFRLKYHSQSAARLTRRDRRQDGGAVGPCPSPGLGGSSVRGEARGSGTGDSEHQGPLIEPLQQSCLTRMLRAGVWVEQRSGGSHSRQVRLQRRRLQRPTRDLWRPNRRGWRAVPRHRGASLGFRIQGGDAGGQDGEMGGKGPDRVCLCGYIQYQIRWDTEYATRPKCSQRLFFFSIGWTLEKPSFAKK